jgi:hypothetical protein
MMSSHQEPRFETRSPTRRLGIAASLSPSVCSSPKHRAIVLVALLSTVVAMIAWGAFNASAATGRPGAISFAVGVSDSEASTFRSIHWAGLKVTRARAIVPYDVAVRSRRDRRRRAFNDWLAAARQRGVEPKVAFRSFTSGARTGSFRAPTPAEFASAFRAFIAAYGPGTAANVRIIGPWNEPNFTLSKTYTVAGAPLWRDSADGACARPTPDNCGPLLAAFYWRLAKAACPACVLVAGEFAGRPGDRYVADYKHFMRSHRPELWGWHPYADANRYQSRGDASARGTRFILTSLGGTWGRSHIWLDAVGAYRRDHTGRVWSETSQCNTTAFILRLPKLNPRITRIYYYNYMNDNMANQDRGLLNPGTPSGHVRRAYFKLAGRDDRPCR